MLDEWHKKNHASYAGLTNAVHDLLERILKTDRVDFLAITSRTKTRESLAEKIDRKE